ncbi:MAG: ferritin [Desulfurococcales archaeon]|nr:ferritin [Desulfurococcales archaeon]
MIPSALLEELNRQLNRELYSAYLYLSMASYFEERGLNGFAHWFKLQAKEELEHAMKFYNYIHERGGHVEFYPIQEPASNWDNITGLVKSALEHEKEITRHINHLLDLARKLDDKPTEVFLYWFITEQVEEEKAFQELLQVLEYAGETPQTVLMLNAKLAQRK